MVERQVTLSVPRDAVWTAITDPEDVGSWFEADVQWDLRPGGAARFWEPDGTRRTGRVVTVREGEVLRFRWWPEDETGAEPASEVTYTLEDVPGGTRLTVTEEPIEGPGPAACVERWDRWDLRMLGLVIRSEARLAVRV